MISIKDLEHKLPSEALLSFQKLFDSSIYNKMLNSFRTEKASTFRINTLKSNLSEVTELMQKHDAKIKNFESIKNAFYFYGRLNKIMKTELVTGGKIYFQSLSSMLPAIVLEPCKNDNVLDIAAAPGSKTTLMASLMKNTGSITAIEPDFIRMERLKYNSELLGVKNVSFIKGYGESFYKNNEEKFDKVLADVPCSGEGRFNIYDRSSYGSWRQNEIKKFSSLQKKLLKSAILSAKKGAVIVYSTCTLNVYENEEVIDSLLNDSDFKIDVLPLNVLKNIPEKINPFLKWENKTFSPKIVNALRIIPSERFEGFFICKIKRIA